MSICLYVMFPYCSELPSSLRVTSLPYKADIWHNGVYTFPRHPVRSRQTRLRSGRVEIVPSTQHLYAVPR